MISERIKRWWTIHYKALGRKTWAHLHGQMFIVENFGESVLQSSLITNLVSQTLPFV